LKEHGVVAIVRVCEKNYSEKSIVAAGIAFYDWEFDDGDPPPDKIVSNWNKLTSEVFSAANRAKFPKACIAVHCVAGLGRAPVLVAINLIEGGMKAQDSILFIRDKRRGAINTKQVAYLNIYKRQKKDAKCAQS